jgi:hypothetical protein
VGTIVLGSQVKLALGQEEKINLHFSVEYGKELRLGDPIRIIQSSSLESCISSNDSI